MTVGELQDMLEYLNPDTPVCMSTWQEDGWMRVGRVYRPERAIDGDEGFEWFTLIAAAEEVDMRDCGYEQPAPKPPVFTNDLKQGRHERGVAW